MPFNFGGFAGGFAGGLQRGQQMKLQADEHKLKAKMLENMLKQQEQAQAEQNQRTLELGKFVDQLTKGVPQEVTPGYESPEQQMSVAPTTAYRPATPQENFAQGLKTVPEAHRYNLLEQQMKPQGGQRPLSVGVGGAVFDPVTQKEIYRNPTERVGVGIDSITMSRLMKEHPGASIDELRDLYNQQTKKTAESRSAGAETGKLGVQQTPEFQQNITNKAMAQAAGQPIPPGQGEKLMGNAKVSQSLARLRANLKPEFLGPIRGQDFVFETRRLGGAAIGNPLSEQETMFRTELNNLKNTALYDASGAQINEQEQKRIANVLPKATDEPAVFEAALKRYEAEVAKIGAMRREVITTPRGAVQQPGRSIPPPPAGWRPR